MKITKSQLKEIIKEEVSKLQELRNIIRESLEDSEEFVPEIGMIAGNQTDGLGYKGTIEHVGEDYFVLRNTKSKATGNGPILIKPSQYFRFKEWGYHLPDNGRPKEFDNMMGNPLDSMDFYNQNR